jgi:hypothetical protein
MGHDYESVRTEDFAEFDFAAKDKSRTTTMPGDDEVLYSSKTRVP